MHHGCCLLPAFTLAIPTQELQAALDRGRQAGRSAALQSRGGGAQAQAHTGVVGQTQSHGCTGNVAEAQAHTSSVREAAAQRSHHQLPASNNQAGSIDPPDTHTHTSLKAGGLLQEHQSSDGNSIGSVHDRGWVRSDAEGSVGDVHGGKSSNGVESSERSSGGSHRKREGSSREAGQANSSSSSSSSNSSSSSSNNGRSTGGRLAKQQQQQEQQQQQQQQQQRMPAKKEKVKEVFFGPKIAPHDKEVRLKRARQWLVDGMK